MALLAAERLPGATKVFTDNILVACPLHPDHQTADPVHHNEKAAQMFMRVIDAIAVYQLCLATKGFFVRDGIALGITI